jgi:predicted small secreted protein
VRRCAAYHCAQAAGFVIELSGYSGVFTLCQRSSIAGAPVARRSFRQRNLTMCKQFAKELIAALCAIGLLGTLSACNTIHGAGQDIEKGGEKIQQKADQHR